MRRKLAAAILLAATIPAAAYAYLSQDGTKLANGAGKCEVCSSGWTWTGTGYTCSGQVKTEQPNCRPAMRVVGGAIIYNDRGDRTVQPGQILKGR
ncbi:MAG: hypothetical protein V4659_01890 [Pseudomonadota bacterium]